MATYNVRPGEHAFSPLLRAWHRKPSRLGYFALFRESCRYDHADADQADWNKLVGETFWPLDNHANSVMIGWRWNVEEQAFELNRYAHVEGQRVMGPPLLTVAPVEWFAVWFVVDYKAARIDLFVQRSSDRKTVQVSQDMPYLKSWWVRWIGFTRQIGPWFGGNRPAPHEMQLGLRDVSMWLANGQPDWDEIEGN